jgi:predicted lysophospholipase L1 biosynthesis ABC-type transport system permease subunit
VIVNEEFVRRFAATGTPLGRRVQNGDRTYRICGVARTTLYESFDEDPTPIVYFSFRDWPRSAGEIHVRTREGAEMAIAADLRRAVREVDAALPLYDVRTMSEHVEKNLFLRRVPARMFAVLGPLLLVLAAIGIYAVVAYGVAQRTTEIGIRIALGATAQSVVALMLRRSMRPVAVGAVVGIAAAVGVAQILPSVLFGVSPLDPVALFGAAAVVGGAALAAGTLPARRAARVDPSRTLHYD